MRRHIYAIIFWLIVCQIPMPGQQKEDLLFEEIPIVITASRKQQLLTESPSVISVISGEDIRQSGYNTIPDLLRTVAGVEVIAISARDQQVGIRGLNSFQSNKLLVMIDGRSVYINLYGNVFWDMLPINLEDIERVEVVKSPASSLYGANAFNGVINIITKTRSEKRAMAVNLNGGSKWAGASALYQDSTRRLWYKLSTGFDVQEDWDGALKESGTTYRFNGVVGVDWSERQSLSLSLGSAQAQDRNFFSGFDVGPSTFDGALRYVSLSGKFSQFRFKTSFSNLFADISDHNQLADIRGNTYDLDLECLHTFQVGQKHAVVWGFNYKLHAIDEERYFTEASTQNLFALFIEDEYAISSRFKMTLGARFDTHPLVGDHLSPRCSLFFRPMEDHILRFSISNAYRNPSSFNSYVNLVTRINTVESTPWGDLVVPVTYSTLGNRDLISEGVVAYELGYFSKAFKRVTLNLNLFFKQYKNFITLVPLVDTYGANELFPGSPPGLFPKALTNLFTNIGGARSWGGEFSLDFVLNRNLTGFFNYSYQKLVNDSDDPSTLFESEKDRVDPRFPMHKVNGGLRFKSRSFSSQLLFHWVDSIRFPVSTTINLDARMATPAYALVNLRAGLALDSRGTELYLVAHNLFDNQHSEFPHVVSPPGYAGLVIGRQFTAGLRFTL